jgi:hypothetical protein
MISSRTARVAGADGVGRAVEVVLGLLGHRERAGDGHLRRLARVRAQELEVADLHGMTARDRANDARHGIGVPAAVERRPGVVDVDAVERRREPVRVALSRRISPSVMMSSPARS